LVCSSTHTWSWKLQQKIRLFGYQIFVTLSFSNYLEKVKFFTPWCIKT
jgi:hypothetical protein